MKNLSTRPASHSRGSALLVVLALLLLLTTLTVAFLSRATFERQLSNASFSQGKVDLAGQGAITAIIGDLQQEIAAGSNVGAGTTIPTVAAGYYYPNAPATVVPAIVGFTQAAGLEDLLKISKNTWAFYSGSNYNASYPASNRAAPISTGISSLNGRLISNARWNAPLLLAPDTTKTGNPPLSGNFVAPDWIYVARDGSNPTAWDSSYEYVQSVPPTTAPATGTPGYNPVTQRYAYAIYDEGSTLDLNTAGSPIITTGGALGAAGGYSNNQPYKNALAYADLTQLPGISSLSGTNQQAFINAIVGWRNFASSGLVGSTISNIFPNNYSFTATLGGNAWYFDQNVIFNPGGYLTANAPAIYNTTPIYGPQYGPNHQNAKNQTDNAFASRQQLLQFFLLNLGQNSTFTGKVPLATLTNVLPYLGTFSRDISQPSYAPDPNRPVVQSTTNGGNDMAGLLNSTPSNNSTYAYTATGATTAQITINPAFLNLTVTASTPQWLRNDGSTSVVGEPLVKKRFALSRLAWLTFMGPIADDNGYLNNNSHSALYVAANAANFTTIINLLENTYGYPASFLSQGGPTNISRYFGLVWLGPNNTLVTGGTGGDASFTIGIDDGTQKWKYVHGAGVSGKGLAASAATTPGRINTLTQVQGDYRDPDFFELLKAAVTVGAIAKPGTPAGVSITTGTASATPSGYSNQKDSSVDAYIMQLGANIIAESNPANYCPRIIFDDGSLFILASSGKSLPQEYRGIEDLPYLYRFRSSPVKTVESSPKEQMNDGGVQSTVYTTNPGGNADFLEVPEIWNPHAWNPNATVYSGISPLGVAGSEFKITMLSNDPNGYYNATGASVGTPSLGSTQLVFCSRFNSTTSLIGEHMNGTPLAAFTFSGELVPNGPVPWISFNIPSTGLNFFREPTLLDKPAATAATGVGGPPFGSGITSSISALGYITSVFKSAAYTKTTDNLKYLGFCLSPPNQPTNWYPLPTLSSLFIKGDGTGGTTANDWYEVGDFGADYDGGGRGPGNYNFTYRLQYLDPLGSGNYITYDEKFLPLAVPLDGVEPGGNAFLAGTAGNAVWPGTAAYGSDADPTSGDDFTLVADPRTNRWASGAAVFSGRAYYSPYVPPPMTATGQGFYDGEGTGWGGWADTSSANGLTYSQSVNAVISAGPDFNLGWPAACPSSALGFYNLQSAYGLSFMTASAIAQNSVSTTVSPGTASPGTYASASLITSYPPIHGSYATLVQFYADPDGVVRRGAAGYLLGGVVQPLGLPLATSTSYFGGVVAPATVPGTPINNGNRPVMLHRPFRTVGELGYVFSGTPGKNIDFSTPESGYSALLDVFCINDTNDPNNLVAGKVNINTRQAPVLEAILGAAYKDELSSYFTASNTIQGAAGTTNEAAALITDSSNGLIHRTSNLTSASLGPLRNISELVGKYVNSNYSSAQITGATPATPSAYNGSMCYSGFSGDLYNIAASGTSVPPMTTVQRFHEAAIRALAANTTSRVWNLMIDVIAQTGRFPASAANATTPLASFNVEGERRYWVHVAIDRYTGKVLDEQVEEVKE